MSQSSKRFLPKSIGTISTFHKVVKNCKATPLLLRSCFFAMSLEKLPRMKYSVERGWVGPNTATICTLFLFNLNAGKELYSSLWLIF